MVSGLYRLRAARLSERQLRALSFSIAFASSDAASVCSGSIVFLLESVSANVVEPVSLRVSAAQADDKPARMQNRGRRSGIAARFDLVL
jgi:hypothetical protein